MSTDGGKDSSWASAMRFIVIMGLVSLFADVTYEGCRGVSGQYLLSLGASAAVVGTVCGAGELVGYGLRFFSGYIADRTKQYWMITIAGYAINLLAVPALSLTGNWQAAAVLLLVERLGKAVRTPARDTMLSYAGSRVGQGFGFGLHEAMDQIGAVTGPVIMALVLAGGFSYRLALATLLIPAVLAIAILLIGKLTFPVPRLLEVKAPTIGKGALPRAFYIYVAGVSLIAFGYADFPLIAYHLSRHAALAPFWIPALYALAMAVDAAAALALGFLFDRWGFLVLPASFFFSSFFAPAAFLMGPPLAFCGVALWGLGMGAQESIMRAATATLVDVDSRASAYGIMGLSYGVSWFLGSALMGFLLDVSVYYVVALSLCTQLLALPVFFLVQRELERSGSGS